MSKYAATTSVPVERSRAEIEKVLARYGANGFMYGWDNGRAVIAFRMSNRMIRFELPLPDRMDPRFTKDKSGYARADSAAQKLYEQEIRSRWRALVLVIKAKLEAVESQIASFESEFLAYLVMPNGRTVGEILLPQIDDAYARNRMPQLMPGRGDEDDD